MPEPPHAPPLRPPDHPRPEGDLPTREQGDLLTHLLREKKVVRGDDDRHTLGLHGPQHLQQRLPVGLVQAVERLVEKDQTRLSRDAARQQDPLPLSARELPESTTAHVRQPDRLQRLHAPRPCRPSGEPAEAERRVGSHEDDVERSHREAWVQIGGLRHVADRTARCATGGGPADSHAPLHD